MNARKRVALALGGVAVGTAGVTARWLAGKVGSQQSFNELLEVFTYRLGQVSGIAYGRVAVAADDRVDAKHAMDLAYFEHTFDVFTDINGKDGRWIKARFQNQPGGTGRVNATLTGDEDTLIRLAAWLRRMPLSTFGGVHLNGRRTALHFWMDDSQYEDARQQVARLQARYGPGAEIKPAKLEDRTLDHGPGSTN